ncbi:Rtf2 RING-finger-domain-containing protein [Dactylonectria macrodidyma]|uniref:Rtf2 RING-finger-domain-containing protein n=1 Tax=Dactylonectria macrodidyma TaxID=307937 RepID=A0A9P9FQF7_9HYPO|nr:Rtf2 RING-finger-domain-containing protein [Dactylonectria macrodidyma]
MGNDGGSIPKRHELVKNAARAKTISELKATALESLSHAWTHCALSGEPVDLDTLVSDWRGRLYNYEAVLNALMPSDEPAEITPASLGIKSLRDVVRLKVSKEGKNLVCPISMKELGPSTKAVYLIPCGHVFAEVAVKEIQEKACPECATEYSQDNVIPLLPTTEADISRLESRIDDLRSQGLTHTLKKDKSEKKKKRKGDDVKDEEKKANAEAKGSKKTEDSRISGINNSFAASLTAKVLAEQDERNKRRKLAAAEAAPQRREAARG